MLPATISGSSHGRPSSLPGVNVLVMAASCLAGSFAAATQPPAPSDLAAKVDQYVAARVARDHFSGSILIARDGRVLFAKGYGMANLEHDVPNTPQTKFRLGSITKQFTAAAILILQERGKLNVQDRVKKYVPDAPKAWDEITIHHLLTHTSGIPNYTDLPTFLKTLPVRVTLKELIATFKDRPLDFKPGEKFKYSNSGYILLGQVIEAASGVDYARFMKDTIFDPLGMKDTGYDLAGPIIKHRAAGYVRRLGIVLTNCDFVDMSIPHAAGALYSTVEDLLKWDQALYTDRLLSSKSREAMFTPFKDKYGYGWIIDTSTGRTRHAHGGGIMGFVTTIDRYPDDRLLVVALSNLENSPVWAMGVDLAALTRGEKYVIPRDPKVAKVDPGVYDRYAGDYEGEDAGKGKEILTIAREKDRLTLQPRGKSKVVLIPETETSFYVRSTDAEVRFLRDDSGGVAGLDLIQSGRELKARRLPAGKSGKDDVKGGAKASAGEKPGKAPAAKLPAGSRGS